MHCACSGMIQMIEMRRMIEVRHGLEMKESEGNKIHEKRYEDESSTRVTSSIYTFFESFTWIRRAMKTFP